MSDLLKPVLKDVVKYSGTIYPIYTNTSFHAQLADLGSGEVSLTATGSGASQTPTFTRATTATTVNSSGTIVSVSSGVARSYYDPTTLQYLGYLAEGQRQNLCLQSEDFATTWTTSNSSVTTNSTTSPSGAVNADKLIENATTNVHAVVQSITFAATTTYSISVFVKASERSWIYIQPPTTPFGATTRAWFNIAGAAVGTQTNCTGTIQAYPSGWYRCTIVATTTVGGVGNLTIQVTTGNNTTSYAGDGTSGIFVWGAQVEAGSFPSTYIPTTASAVTRNADVLTYPFSGNMVSATGSAYAELSTLWSAATGVVQTALSANTATTFNVGTGNPSTAIRSSDATNLVSKSGLTSMNTGARKRACAWGGSTLQITGDGLVVASGSFDGTMGDTTIGIGCRASASDQQWFGTIRNVRIWPTQFSAAQLEQITGS